MCYSCWRRSSPGGRHEAERRSARLAARRIDAVGSLPPRSVSPDPNRRRLPRRREETFTDLSTRHPTRNQRDVTSPRTLRLGVIGLAAEWETVHQPALSRMAARGEVVALHLTSRRRAAETASLCGAQAIGSLRRLTRLPLDGVVIPAPAWYGWFPVIACLEQGRSCLTALPDDVPLDLLRRLHAAAQSQGVLAMPELRLRCTPATLRLRELLATELGAAQEIEIRSLAPLPVPADRAALLAFDWCRTIIAGTPLTIDARSDADAADGETFVAELQWSPARGSGRVAASVRLHSSQLRPATPALPAAARSPGAGSAPPTDASTTPGATPAPATGVGGSAAAADGWPLEFVIRTRHGEARLEDAAHLRWRCGGLERSESLSVERPAAAVILDHFARRLAGGLIPVPDLGDLCAASQLAAAAARSRQERRTVSLTDDGHVV